MSFLYHGTEGKSITHPIVKEDIANNILNENISEINSNKEKKNENEKDNILAKLEFMCTQCKRNFWDNSSLDNHIKAHIEKKIFSCKECGKSYPKSSRLKIHLRTHSGERPFKCTYPNCGKNFNENANLKAHIRIHTGEKPYACKFPNCIKKFKTFGQFSDHRKVHSEEKKYSCSQCYRKFKRVTSLKLHFKSHTLNSDSKKNSQNEQAINFIKDNESITNYPIRINSSINNIKSLDEKIINLKEHYPSLHIPQLDLLKTTKGPTNLFQPSINQNHESANQMHFKLNSNEAYTNSNSVFNSSFLQSFNCFPNISNSSRDGLFYPNNFFAFSPLGLNNNPCISNSLKSQGSFFTPNLLTPSLMLQGTQFNIK